MNLRTLASARLIGTKPFDLHSPELYASLAKKFPACQIKAMTHVSDVSNEYVSNESPEWTVATCGYNTKDEPPWSPGLQAA